MLTWLLKESLGGNAKALIIGNVGPADYNYDETFRTLRCISAARKIQNKPKVNKNLSISMIEEFKK